MILVIGHQGQVAHSFAEIGTAQGLQVRNLGRKDVDFHDFSKFSKMIHEMKPQILVNAAAYTAVDKAETEKEECFFANEKLPDFLAAQAAELKIPFVHFSTDYVFSGEGSVAWKEEDPTSPASIYGQSKLAGEERIIARGGQYLIFRTSWVYSSFGYNFLKTMLKLGAEKTSLKIVDDQIGAPTYSDDLVSAVLLVLEKSQKLLLEGQLFPSGIYHLSGSGEISWFEFAQEIFRLAREMSFPIKIEKVEPIPSRDYPTPAKRPLNSRLNQNKIWNTFAIRMPNWRDSLKTCMHKLKETK